MKKQYKNEWFLFKSNYRKFFLFTCFFVLFLSFFVYEWLIYDPSEIKAFYQFFAIPIQAGNGRHSTTNLQDFFLILLQNVTICLAILGLGLIPLIPVSLFFTLLTPLSLSVLFSIDKLIIHRVSPLFISILPHGIIEFTAIFYTTSISLFLSFSVFKKIKDKRAFHTLYPVLIQSVTSFIVVTVPLLVVAAVIEAYIRL